MSEEAPAPPFILWSEDDFRALLKRGDDLFANPRALPEYAGPALMAHTLLLDESFRRLIQRAGTAEKLEDSLKMVALAYKGHDAWRGIMEPLSKRVFAEMGKELKSGKSKQVSGASGSRPRLGPGRRRGEGEPRPQTDTAAGGSAGIVEAEPVGLPDSERPGHGTGDSQDD